MKSSIKRLRVFAGPNGSGKSTIIRALQSLLINNLPLDLLYEASKVCYQVYFFDNSKNVSQASLVANFKMLNGKRKWEKLETEALPNWFSKYYLEKILEE